jgi:hypothetical protein
MTTPKRRQVMARAQAALRRRERERGIVRVLVKVHAKRRPQLEDIVGEWMLEDLVPPDVVDP